LLQPVAESLSKRSAALCRVAFGNKRAGKIDMPAQKLIAKIITIVLFSLLIFSFAIWGIGDMFLRIGQQELVAEVGDQDIERETYVRAFNRELNQLSRRFGSQIDRDQARLMGIDRQVLDVLISRALLNQEAEHLGLRVTDDQVKARIAEEPAFRNELGQFSRQRFDQVLYNAGLTEAGYIRDLRQETKSRQLTGAVIDAVKSPEALADAIYAYRQERRVADYIVVPLVAEDAVAAPDDEALTAYYEEHGNSFMAPEYRSVTLVDIRPEDVAAEISVSDDELKEAFEARKDDFAVPETRSLEQIVFQTQEEADVAYKRLQAGEDFAAVAQDLTGAAPLDLGPSTKESLLPPLAEAAFALEGASFTSAVESALGWHILRVTDIEPGHEPSFEEVRDQLRDDIVESKAIDGVIALANNFDDELGSGATLEDAAAALALEVQKIPAIDRSGLDKDGNVVPDLPPLDEFTRAVEETEEGSTSLLIEAGDGSHFVVRVDSIQPAAERPFDEVRDQVEQLWRQAERQKLTGEKAEELVDALADEVPIADVAAQEDLTLRKTSPLTRDERAAERSPAPQLATSLFQMKPGEVSALPAQAGYVVAQLREIVPADKTSDSQGLEALRRTLDSNLKADYLDLYMNALTQEFGVTINQQVADNALKAY